MSNEETKSPRAILNPEEAAQTQRQKWLDMHKDDKPLCSAIDAACEKYGDTEVEVLCLSRPIGAVAVFRAPLASEYQRFMGGILNDNPEKKAIAAVHMARACVLYPVKSEFVAWTDKYGGIGNAVLKPLSRLAGAELADRGKE